MCHICSAVKIISSVFFSKYTKFKSYQFHPKLLQFCLSIDKQQKKNMFDKGGLMVGRPVSLHRASNRSIWIHMLADHQCMNAIQAARI